MFMLIQSHLVGSSKNCSCCRVLLVCARLCAGKKKRGSLPGERSFCKGARGTKKAFSSVEQWQKSQQCQKQRRPSSGLLSLFLLCASFKKSACVMGAAPLGQLSVWEEEGGTALPSGAKNSSATDFYLLFLDLEADVAACYCSLGDSWCPKGSFCCTSVSCVFPSFFRRLEPAVVSTLGYFLNG